MGQLQSSRRLTDAFSKDENEPPGFGCAGGKHRQTRSPPLRRQGSSRELPDAGRKTFPRLAPGQGYNMVGIAATT